MRIQALTLVDQSDAGGEGRWETREVDVKLTLPNVTSAALLWSDLSKDDLISGTYNSAGAFCRDCIACSASCIHAMVASCYDDERPCRMREDAAAPRIQSRAGIVDLMLSCAAELD